LKYERYFPVFVSPAVELHMILDVLGNTCGRWAASTNVWSL